jgi:hypothetical protein
MVNICTGGKVIVYFAASWLRQPRFKQADYAFRRGKDMLQKRLFYMFSDICVLDSSRRLLRREERKRGKG